MKGHVRETADIISVFRSIQVRVSRAQTQAWSRQLNGNIAQHNHIGTLQALTAITTVPLRDRCQGSDFASLSGNSGHRAIFGAQRSVASDPMPTLANVGRNKAIAPYGPYFLGAACSY